MAGLLFLQNYVDYYSVKVHNKIVALCDNKGYVNKLQKLIKYPKSIALIHKMNESKALILILQNILTNFSILYTTSHQDDNTNYNNLPVYAQLNVDADHLATKNITLPLNKHLDSRIFALYMNGKYLHANISKDIRAKSHEKKARQFLRKKYIWNARVVHSIAWHKLTFSFKKQKNRRSTIK